MIIVYTNKEMLNQFIEKGDSFYDWFNENKGSFNSILYIKAIKNNHQYYIEVKSQFETKALTYKIDISKEDFQYILEENI